MASAVRREIDLSVTSPFDAERLAAKRGIEIIELRDLLEYGFPTLGLQHFAKNDRVSAAYCIVHENPKILLFRETAPTRRVSDLAHELAHHELDHKPTELFDRIGCMCWDKDQEDEAKWLSGCLLVPADAAVRLLRAGHTSAECAQILGVSHTMFAWRANVTGAPRRAGMVRVRGK